MRVLHLSDRASSRGGADCHLTGVVKALAERGCEQLLVVGREDGTAAPTCDVRVLAGLDAACLVPPLSLVRRLDALCARWQPDVLHVHNAVAPELLAWAAAREAVATVQDHRSFCPGRGKLTKDGTICRERMTPGLCAGCFDDAAYHARIQALTERRLEALGRMRRVIVLSRYMQRELASVGVDRVEVVPPFVDGLDPRACADGPPCVLFAGRLVAAKGVADAVEAWRRARVDLPLVVAGTGAERARLPSADGVHVLGWIAHERMSGVFRRARALLMPSRWQEPFGIVGLEALTLGVPVVAWESGGVAEWHPGGELLVPWGDVDALARALRRALTAPPEVCAPDGFDRSGLTDRLLSVYREQTPAPDRETL